MKADGTPDLANIVFEPTVEQWNVPATWKVKGAATLEGPGREICYMECNLRHVSIYALCKLCGSKLKIRVQTVKIGWHRNC